MLPIDYREQVVKLTGLLNQFQEDSPKLDDHFLIVVEYIPEDPSEAVRIHVQALVQLVYCLLADVLAKEVAFVDHVLPDASERPLAPIVLLQSLVQPLLQVRPIYLTVAFFRGSAELGQGQIHSRIQVLPR